MIKATYENINIGDTVRLYLQIDDLIDGSGNPIHISSIDKISIEKLNNSIVNYNQPNKIVKGFYGPQNAKITIPDNQLNFFQFAINTSQGNKIVRVDNGNYYVKIISPEKIQGLYKIDAIPAEEVDDNNNPIGRSLIISGIYSTVEECYFQIVDLNDNIVFFYTNTEREPATISIDDSINFFSPLWTKDLSLFKDASLINDFSNIDDTYSITLSTDSLFTDAKEYSILQQLESNSFTIEGFENSEDNSGQVVYYWEIRNSSNTIVFSGSNGRIIPLYYSPVHAEQYTNENGILLNRYYVDWKIEDNIEGGEGSYIVYWHYIKDICKEIQSVQLLIHNDFTIPEIMNRKFNRDNYHELLMNYLPFFYKDYQADDILSQTIKAFGESIFDLQFKVDQMNQVLDPSTTPTQFLPYLSNLFSYNLKSDNPINWRQQLKNLPKILKKKGTLEALVEILNLTGTDVLSILFYWQVKSFYVWTDYFYLNNTSDEEILQLNKNPLVQLTGYNQAQNFSRYSIEYYSQDKEKWYELNWVRYDNTGEIIDSQDVNDVLFFELIENKNRSSIFSKKVKWNWQNRLVTRFFIISKSPLIENDISNINFEDDDFINSLTEYEVRIIHGKTNQGLFRINNIILDANIPTNNRIEIEYLGDPKTIIDEGNSGANIVFVFYRNGQQILTEFTGLLRSEDSIALSIKDTLGRIRGKNGDSYEYFTPLFNDIIKIRYQYNAYPYETNSSCSNYRIGFDESEVCKDDYVLSLPLADNRELYDSVFENSRIIPPVNFNVRLIPDSSCFIKTPEDFCSLHCLETSLGNIRSYDIHDICSKKNPLQQPIVYGHIRTKFPWSENVYNMDEYDGSTRPSYLPCDIDEDFLDSCGCCWSSFFSISVSVKNLSDRMISSIKELIEEFKPFHARILNISFVGKFEENLLVEDSNEISYEIRGKYLENLELGYYPRNYRNRVIENQQDRSETFFFANDTFYTQASDFNIYLRDNIAFTELDIQTKNTNTGTLLPTQVNTNHSRIVINSISGIHAGKTYNISGIWNKRLELIDALDDNGDNLPSLPYSQEGPWEYTIYTRKYPDTAVEITELNPWPQSVSVNIIKKGKYVITTSVNLLENGIEISSTVLGQNSYSVYIESGNAISGYYNIVKNNDNTLEIDYPYSDASVGDIVFTVYNNSQIVENLESILGTLVKEEVFGQFEIGTGNFLNDWPINIPIAYVQVDDDIYYKLYSIEDNVITFSGYSLGTDGTHSIQIFEKILESSSGFIVAYTDTIHVTNTDIYNIIASSGEERIRDFLIGIEISGNVYYYDITEIFSSDHYKLKVISEVFDNIISGNCYLRIHALTDYYENSLLPKYNEDIVLVGTATNGSSTTLEDATLDFSLLNVYPGDIVYKFPSTTDITQYPKNEIPPLAIDDGWGLVTSVSGNTINITSLIQNGSARSFSTGDNYRIIRRRLYDIRKVVKNIDVVKLEFPLMEGSQTLQTISVPVQNLEEISPGNYNLQLASKLYDNHQAIEVYKSKTLITENIIVGPLDNVNPIYLPLNYQDYRVINKDPIIGTNEFEDQFVIQIFDKLEIDPDNITVIVNRRTWSRVDQWTDPDAAPGQYALREYLVRPITPKEIHIHFGDGITGKRIEIGDIIEIRYFNSGKVTGPLMPEEVDISMTDRKLDSYELKDSIATGPLDVLTEREYVYFVIEDINSGQKYKIYVG